MNLNSDESSDPFGQQVLKQNDEQLEDLYSQLPNQPVQSPAFDDVQQMALAEPDEVPPQQQAAEAPNSTAANCIANLECRRPAWWRSS